MGSKSADLKINLIDNVSKPARTVAEALKQAETEVKRVAKAMSETGASDKLVASLAKLKLGKQDIEQVANAWRDYAKANNLAKDSSQWTKAQVAQEAAWRQRTIADIKAVSAARRAEDRVEAQLKRDQAARMEQGQHQRRKWLEGDRSMVAMVGAAALGGGMVEAARHTIKVAAEAEQLRFRIRELSRSNPAEALDADALAAEVAARYPSISVGKAYDNYLELRANAVDAHGVIDPAVARRNMFVAAKAQTAATALGFDMTPEDMQNLLKGVEGSGRADDPKAVEKITDAYLRAKQVFGTAIASSMVRDYVANAKSANFSIGDDQFYLANMVRMSEGNASRLGNETNQTLSTLVGGSMKKAAGQWLIEHKLADAADMENTGGGNVRFRHGIKGSDVLQINQGKWAASTLKASIEGSAALSEKNVEARMALLRKETPDADERFLRNRAEEGLIAAVLAKTGWRTTVTDNLAHLIGNERLLERDIAALKQASGSDAAERIKENTIGAFKEFTAVLDSFATVVGSPAMQVAGPILDSAARSIAGYTKNLGDWAKANPGLAKAGSIGAIAAGVVGGGALTYGALSGLMSGFGLKGSAVALDGAAMRLSAAAAALGRGGLPGVAPGGPGGVAPGGVPGKGLRVRAGLGMVTGALDVLNGPSSDQELATSYNAWNKWFEGTDIGKTLIKLGVAVPAPQMIADPSPGGPGWRAYRPPGPATMPNPWEPERRIPVAPAAAPSPAPAPDLSASINEVDTFGVKLGEATTKANEMTAAASKTVTPQVDTSSIDNAMTKVSQLGAALAGLGGKIAGAIPSIGPTVRGSFADHPRGGH